jgi:hypothetical protein
MVPRFLTSLDRTLGIRKRASYQATAAMVGAIAGCGGGRQVRDLGWKLHIPTAFSNPIPRRTDLREGDLGSPPRGACNCLLRGADGMGYPERSGGISAECMEAGQCEIGAGGKLVPARAHRRPPYDPGGNKGWL